MPWLLGLAWVAQSGSSADRRAPPDASGLVAKYGLEVLQGAWLDPEPTGIEALWNRPRFLFVGARPGETPDVYLGRGRFDVGGRLRALSAPSNLSRTPGAREHSLLVTQGRAAWLVSTEGAHAAVELATFEPLRGPVDVVRCWVLRASECGASARPQDQQTWTRLEQWQDRISRWQQYGMAENVSRARLRIEPLAHDARLSWAPEGISLDVDGERIVSAFPGPKAVEPPPSSSLSERFHYEPEPSARPGNVTTWLAEALRETSLGEQGVALLKAVGFAGRDYAARAAGALSEKDPSELLHDDLGHLLQGRARGAADGAWEGWPPAPLEPPLGKALENEGAWLSLDDDPFVAKGPQGRAPFLFSFVRPDAQRPYVRVYVMLWDPRRVELHAVGGTVEPRSSTGERGSGRVPRDPKVLRRLVGAFNGAFRTRHGEFGMAAGGTVYLPPKPYAATVATLTDGSTRLGTWPDRPGLPRDIVSYRQNLTPLLQDGVPNPYRRHYWGGMPEGWQHESYTVRTALCLTRDGYLAYLYGDHLNPSSLIAAAQAARCDYALHLDMNAGHTGFELYRVFDAAAPAPAVGPLESSWQARGSVTGAPGYEYVARRLTKHMPLMNFPRYVHREQRDFFYLTLRPSIGMRALPESWGAGGPSGGWHLGAPGLRGAPSPWAFADVRPFASAPEETLHILTADPLRLSATPAGSSAPLTINSHEEGPLLLTATGAATERAEPLALVESAPEPASAGSPRLWWSGGRFVLHPRQPSPEAVCVAQLSPAAPQNSSAMALDRSSAVALVGVDEDGFLIYAEVSTGRTVTIAELAEVARRLALEEHVALAARITWRFGEATGRPHGEQAATAPAHGERRRHAAQLWAVEGPNAGRLFPRTPVVDPGVWAYRQLEHLSLEPRADSRSAHTVF